MNLFNKNKKINDLIIMIVGSIIIIGIYIHMVNTRQIERFISEDSYLGKINIKIRNNLNSIFDKINQKLNITKKSNEHINMDIKKTETDIEKGKLPKDMNDNTTFNNDYKQFLSNNDIISSEIKKLEKEISYEEQELKKAGAFDKKLNGNPEHCKYVDVTQGNLCPVTHPNTITDKLYDAKYNLIDKSTKRKSDDEKRYILCCK